MSHKIKQEFGADAIASRMRELGAQIRADAGTSEVFLLGILKGTSCFLADLMRGITGNVSYGFIDVVRDMSDTEIASALEIDFVSYTEIGGRNVYVLKDVVSSGVIENYLLSQLRLHKPKSVKLVALLDRPDLRTVDLSADYKAFEVGDGAWVGYGLEIDGRHGNLPYIGKM
jgi:hypoxanthine phosphoribosyltransferase